MLGTLVPARQRRTMRRSVRVDCQVVRERDFKLIGSRVASTCRPSACWSSAQENVLTGEPVVVSFRLPRSTCWFDTEATVARVVHGRRPGDLGRCFGIAFETLEAEAQAFLLRALRGVPPPLPRREARIDYAASVRLAAS